MGSCGSSTHPERREAKRRALEERLRYPNGKPYAELTSQMNKLCPGRSPQEFDLLFFTWPKERDDATFEARYMECGLVVCWDGEDLLFQYRQNDLVYRFVKYDWVSGLSFNAEATVRSLGVETTAAAGRVFLENGRRIWVEILFETHPLWKLVGKLRFNGGPWKPFLARFHTKKLNFDPKVSKKIRFSNPNETSDRRSESTLESRSRSTDAVLKKAGF